MTPKTLTLTIGAAITASALAIGCGSTAQPEQTTGTPSAEQVERAVDAMRQSNDVCARIVAALTTGDDEQLIAAFPEDMRETVRDDLFNWADHYDELGC